MHHANRESRYWKFLLVVCGLGLCSSAHANADEDLLRAIAEGYRQNRAAFKTVYCQYRVTKGVAPSAEAAIQGKVEAKSSIRVTWVMDENRTRVSCKANDNRVRDSGQSKDKSQSERSVPFLSKDFLEYKELQLVYEPVLTRSGTLYDEKVHQQFFVVTPFSISTTIIVGKKEQSSPATLIEGLLKKQDSQVVHQPNGTMVLEGTSQRYRVENGMKPVLDGILINEYIIDPNQGFLMTLRSQGKKNEQIDKIYAVTDIKECSGKRWFPMRSLILSPSKPGEAVAVTEIQVLSLDVDAAPKDSDFSITLLAGAKIVNRNDPRSSFRIEKEMSTTPNDLPKLFDLAKQSLDARARK